MTDTLDDDAPVLRPETPPTLQIPEAAEGMELAATGVFSDGVYTIGIKTDRGVEFNLSITQEGFEVIDFLLAALPPAVDQILERIIEEMEAGAEQTALLTAAAHEVSNV